MTLPSNVSHMSHILLVDHNNSLGENEGHMYKNTTLPAVIKPRSKEKLNATPRELYRNSTVWTFPQLDFFFFFCTFKPTCLPSQECSFQRGFSLFGYYQWQKGFHHGYPITHCYLLQKEHFSSIPDHVAFVYCLTDGYSERKPSTLTNKGEQRVVLLFFFFLFLPQRCVTDCLH